MHEQLGGECDRARGERRKDRGGHSLVGVWAGGIFCVIVDVYDSERYVPVLVRKTKSKETTMPMTETRERE